MWSTCSDRQTDKQTAVKTVSLSRVAEIVDEDNSIVVGNPVRLLLSLIRRHQVPEEPRVEIRSRPGYIEHFVSE